MESDPLPAGHRALRRAALDRALGLLMPVDSKLSAALTWLAVVETALLDLSEEPQRWRQMAGQHPERRDPLISDARRLAGLLIQLRAQRQGRIDTMLAQAQAQPDDPWAQWTVLMLSGDLKTGHARTGGAARGAGRGVSPRPLSQTLSSSGCRFWPLGERPRRPSLQRGGRRISVRQSGPVFCACPDARFVILGFPARGRAAGRLPARVAAAPLL